MAEPLLRLTGVHTHIGQYHILQGVDLAVPEGELTMLLGRNGAGKTTALRTVMGLWRASSGTLRFAGSDLRALATPDISRLGVGYVPENMGVFAGLTVAENMTLAARDADIDRQRLDWIFSLFPALRRFWSLPAGNLSGGQKQMLAIARAMIEPRRLILIDEPSKGLAPAIVDALIEAMRELKRTATTILMVEQNFRMAQALGDGVAVMDDGRVVHSGRMAALAADAELQARLLGLSLERINERPVLRAHRAPAPAAEGAARRAGALLDGGRAGGGRPHADRDFSTWATLTLAGLAMGMLIFIMASGLTLVFGLMDVMNFGHGAFISIGAFVGGSVLLALGGWAASSSAALNLAAVLLAIAAAMAATGALGWFFERVIVKPVYGAHLKQILVTMGGLIVAEELIRLIWGPNQIPLPRPQVLKGSLVFHDIVIERYRLLAVVLGLAIFAGLRWTLVRTKLGLLIRAAVENGEMVEALGYRVRRLFVLVFVAGSALAGLGGIMWGIYDEIITAQMGLDILVLVFIVVIIGGLGSVDGCFIGALLVGLMANYTGFLAPKVALGSNILLMVAILMWRPRGLLPPGKGK